MLLFEKKEKKNTGKPQEIRTNKTTYLKTEGENHVSLLVLDFYDNVLYLTGAKGHTEVLRLENKNYYLNTTRA